MSEYLEITAWLFITTYIYYIFCNVMYAHFADSMPWLVKAVIVPFLICFDFPLNMLLSLVPFFDAPREFLLTARLKRYKKLINRGYYRLSRLDKLRYRSAVFLCDHKVFGLDRWDKITGDHC